MKITDLRRRLRKDRPMSSVTLRMPEDVIEDLKRIAPALGFSGYQPLMRAYIGQGPRRDIERLQGPPDVGRIGRGLRRHGVSDQVIRSAVEESTSKSGIQPTRRRTARG
jgi:hypothetical protein